MILNLFRFISMFILILIVTRYIILLLKSDFANIKEEYYECLCLAFLFTVTLFCTLILFAFGGK